MCWLLFVFTLTRNSVSKHGVTFFADEGSQNKGENNQPILQI